MRPDTFRRWAAPALVAGLLATGCTGGGSPAPESAVVEVFGPVVGDSADQLGRVLREVSEGTGVELRYVGVTSFPEQLGDRLDRGDRPGVALLPQPGLLADLVQRGVVQDLSPEVVDEVRAAFPAELNDLVTVEGDDPSAVWLTLDAKGLLWFRPAELERRGLAVPTTLDELQSLSETIRAAGGPAPWCVTAEAGASTGWVGTDWVEDYVLRRLGPEAYDRWTAGTLPFDGPEVTAVFEELDGLLRAPGAMVGGSREALTVPWERAPDGLFAATPRCLLLHQADFIRDSFPAGTSIGPDGDVDFVVLPPAEAGAPAPMVVGGLTAAALSDAPGVAEAMSLLAGPEVAAALNATGAFLSPHRGVDESTIADPVDRRVVELVRAAPTVRFDGSDLMPPAVGTGTFWSGMRAFLGGEQVGAVLAEIQEGWPDTSP